MHYARKIDNGRGCGCIDCLIAFLTRLQSCCPSCQVTSSSPTFLLHNPEARIVIISLSWNKISIIFFVAILNQGELGNWYYLCPWCHLPHLSKSKGVYGRFLSVNDDFCWAPIPPCMKGCMSYWKCTSVIDSPLITKKFFFLEYHLCKNVHGSYKSVQWKESSSVRRKSHIEFMSSTYCMNRAIECYSWSLMSYFSW